MINLTVERLNRGYSINSLAEELGVHRNVITRLEAGESVHPSNAKKVADYFGVKVTDLMPVGEPA